MLKTQLQMVQEKKITRMNKIVTNGESQVMACGRSFYSYELCKDLNHLKYRCKEKIFQSVGFSS